MKRLWSKRPNPDRSNSLFARLVATGSTALVRTAFVVRRAGRAFGLAAALAIRIVRVGETVTIVVLAIGAADFRSLARRAGGLSLAGLVFATAAFLRATLRIAGA